MNPAVKEALENVETDNSSSETLRFPLSLGEQQQDVDNKGEPCTVFDIVYNSDVVGQSTVHR